MCLSFEIKFCFVLKWLKTKNEDLYHAIILLHYESEKSTTQSWTENKYGWAPYINFLFTQFVNKAQTFTCSLLSSSLLWLDFPSKRQEVLAADPPQPQGVVTFICHLQITHLQITQYTSFRGGWKYQWLGTFLRNEFHSQGSHSL